MTLGAPNGSGGGVFTAVMALFAAPTTALLAARAGLGKYGSRTVGKRRMFLPRLPGQNLRAARGLGSR